MTPENLDFTFDENPESPVIDPDRESIRLAVTEARYTAPLVTIVFRASFMFPTPVAMRYRDLEEALVLVVNDAGAQDCFAIRTVDQGLIHPEGRSGRPDNLLGDPPLPLPPRGDPGPGQSHRGGWVNGVLSLRSPHPRQGPRIFLYLVLENYVSNTVGIDLLNDRVIDY